MVGLHRQLPGELKQGMLCNGSREVRMAVSQAKELEFCPEGSRKPLIGQGGH
jgi:hypothetical protein